MALIVAVLVLASLGHAQTTWWRTYGGAAPDGGLSVRQTSDGGYIVAGSTLSFGAGAEDVYLIKTNASGDTEWTRTYGATADDEGWAVQQTSDSGYIVSGRTHSFPWDVYLIKTNANGNVAVEEPTIRLLRNSRTALRVQPNPFSSVAVVPGHEAERFILSDISGRKVGICYGNRIGEGLAPGVYFLSPAKSVAPRTRLLRIVKGG